MDHTRKARRNPAKVERVTTGRQGYIWAIYLDLYSLNGYYERSNSYLGTLWSAGGCD